MFSCHVSLIIDKNLRRIDEIILIKLLLLSLQICQKFFIFLKVTGIGEVKPSLFKTITHTELAN